MTCQGFMAVKFGFGVKAGAKWERDGGRPGADTDVDPSKAGMTLGLFGDIELNAGPLQAGWENKWGRDYSMDRNFTDTMKPKWNLGDSWGVRGGVSAGAEISIFTPGQRNVGGGGGCK
ncbi:MAG: hypothetical protein LH647_07475 [Leptolyngbyaceae cyanobacterium CAN_BIN12]|nr:hypothetical protein [Leptolyngbyaceae cyanobacterium CAN_BIN12]